MILRVLAMSCRRCWIRARWSCSFRNARWRSVRGSGSMKRSRGRLGVLWFMINSWCIFSTSPDVVVPRCPGQQCLRDVVAHAHGPPRLDADLAPIRSLPFKGGIHLWERHATPWRCSTTGVLELHVIGPSGNLFRGTFTGHEVVPVGPDRGRKGFADRGHLQSTFSATVGTTSADCGSVPPCSYS